MAIFRIKVSLPTGRISFTGLFHDGFEAVNQTMADYPDASRIAAFFIRRPTT